MPRPKSYRSLLRTLIAVAVAGLLAFASLAAGKPLAAAASTSPP
jgi:hypothetical protein